MLEPRDLTNHQRRACDQETARLQDISARHSRAAFRPAPPDRPWWDDATFRPLEDVARQWHVA